MILELEILKIPACPAVLSGIVNILLTFSVPLLILKISLDFLGIIIMRLLLSLIWDFSPLHDTSRSDMEFIDGISMLGLKIIEDSVLFLIIER